MNNNYSNILKAGYDIEIRSQQFAWAKMYLTQNGVRTGESIQFTGGHFNAEVLLNKAKTTRKETALDRALRHLANSLEVKTALKIIEARETLLSAVETANAGTSQIIKI